MQSEKNNADIQNIAEITKMLLAVKVYAYIMSNWQNSCNQLRENIDELSATALNCSKKIKGLLCKYYCNFVIKSHMSVKHMQQMCQWQIILNVTINWYAKCVLFIGVHQCATLCVCVCTCEFYRCQILVSYCDKCQHFSEVNLILLVCINYETASL